jgi:serine/threonine-protein kinase RIO1
LYQKAQLVHGDLSEYNLLVCPSRLVENRLDNDETALQIVLIDFGQAVDVRHPSAKELLQRDLLRVKEFFDKMDIQTMDLKSAEKFVVSTDEEDAGDDQSSERRQPSG